MIRVRALEQLVHRKLGGSVRGTGMGSERHCHTLYVWHHCTSRLGHIVSPKYSYEFKALTNALENNSVDYSTENYETAEDKSRRL